MSQLFEEKCVGDLASARNVIFWLPGYGLGAEFYRVAASMLWERDRYASRFMTMRGLGIDSGFEFATWNDYADGLLEIVRSARSQPTFILGHSFGAILALLGAIRANDHSLGLMLIEPMVQPNHLFARRVVNHYLRHVIGRDSYSFHNSVAGVQRVADLSTFPAWAIEHHVRGIGALRGGGSAKLFRDYLKLYPMDWRRAIGPTLVVGGEQTGVGPWLSRYLLQRRILGANRVSIPNAGHWIFNEANRAIVEVITKFCIDSMKSSRIN